MYSYGNFIRESNMGKVRNRMFNDVIRNKMKTDSSKPFNFQQNYEAKKKSLSKYDCLSRIKSSYINALNGSVITTKTSTESDKEKVNNTGSKNAVGTEAKDTKEKEANVLNVCNGKTFDISLGYGKKATFTCKNGQVYMTKETGSLSSENLSKVGKVEQLITSLVHEASGNYVKSNFNPREVKSILEEVGIKPGNFTIKSTNSNNSFYMLDNGKIYSNYEVEAERNFYNNTDFIHCFGYSDNAVCTIDGKDYKIGKDGTFSIPSGVVCVPERMTIKK